MGVIHLPAKDSKAHLGPPGPGGGKEGCPEPPKSHHSPPNALISDFRPLESSENKLALFSATQFVIALLRQLQESDVGCLALCLL